MFVVKLTTKFNELHICYIKLKQLITNHGAARNLGPILKKCENIMLYEGTYFFACLNSSNNQLQY